MDKQGDKMWWPTSKYVFHHLWYWINDVTWINMVTWIKWYCDKLPSSPVSFHYFSSFLPWPTPRFPAFQPGAPHRELAAALAVLPCLDRLAPRRPRRGRRAAAACCSWAPSVSKWNWENIGKTLKTSTIDPCQMNIYDDSLRNRPWNLSFSTMNGWVPWMATSQMW